MSRNKLIKSTTGVIVLVIFGLLTAWYASSNWHEFASLAVTNPLLLLAAIVAISINIYAAGAVIDLAMEPHGVKISKYEAFGLANITRFSNQLSPAYVGAAIRATYMKRVHNVSYAKFSSSFVVNNLMQLVVAGIVALSAMLMIAPALSSEYAIVIISISILLFILALILPVNPYVRILDKLEGRFGQKPGKVFERLGAILNGYTTVRKHPRLLLRTIGWFLFISVVSALSYLWIYSALGVEIGFLSALFISAFSSWAVVLSVTPGGIGVTESLMVAAAQIAGVSIASTLVVAILLRLLMFIVSGVFSMYFTPRLLKYGVKKTH